MKNMESIICMGGDNHVSRWLISLSQHHESCVWGVTAIIKNKLHLKCDNNPFPIQRTSFVFLLYKKG